MDRGKKVEIQYDPVQFVVHFDVVIQDVQEESNCEQSMLLTSITNEPSGSFALLFILINSENSFCHIVESASELITTESNLSQWSGDLKSKARVKSKKNQTNSSSYMKIKKAFFLQLHGNANEYFLFK